MQAFAVVVTNDHANDVPRVGTRVQSLSLRRAPVSAQPREHSSTELLLAPPPRLVPQLVATGLLLAVRRLHGRHYVTDMRLVSAPAPAARDDITDPALSAIPRAYQ
ncbi:hypothetical protein GCM10009748_10270 [Agromyces lapidis]